MTFNDLQLIEPILRAVEEEQYTHPTPIQEQAIPVVLKGIDLLGCAQTGTGKTAAFAIPMLQLLSERKGKGIRALILTPTRELAIQIDESFKAYGRHLSIKQTVIFGGVNQHAQVQTLRRGVDILTATPGRLLDLMNQGHVHLDNLEIFVLDEADRMLDMGFVHDVKKVIAVLPQKRQTLFFSATMPKEIVHLANSILSNPIKVEVTPPATTAQTIQQELHFVEFPEKRDKLIQTIQDRQIERALVFTRTKHGANRVAKELVKAGIYAEAIHGNKSQNARQEALNNFKKGKTRMLVATDIAARGIDIDELAFVINFEVPNVPETYVHRIGRTGRAGQTGVAISFVDSEERGYIKDIQRLIGLQIPVVGDVPAPIAFIPTEERRKIAHAARPPRNSNDRNGRGGQSPRGERPAQRSGGKPRSSGAQDAGRSSESRSNEKGTATQPRSNNRGPASSQQRSGGVSQGKSNGQRQEGSRDSGQQRSGNNADGTSQGPKKKRYSKNYKGRNPRPASPASNESSGSSAKDSGSGWLDKLGLGKLFKR